MRIPGYNTYYVRPHNIHVNSHAWLKYVALALAVIAVRFLCCG